MAGTTTVDWAAAAGDEVGLAAWAAGGAPVGGGADADVGFACTTTVGLGLTIGEATDQTTSPPSTSSAAPTTGAAKITACLAGDWSWSRRQSPPSCCSTCPSIDPHDRPIAIGCRGHV